MNVCGVLVYAVPDRTGEVGAALARIPGVELHGRADGGRIILTVEDTETHTAADGLSAIQAAPGVIAPDLPSIRAGPGRGRGRPHGGVKP
jgi:nitrate reductase NapD